MRKVMAILMAILGITVLGIAGCSANKAVTAKTPIQDLKAPDWVVKGSGAFASERGKIFYGVGASSNMENPSLLRTAADNRARNEVGKVFQFYTASLMKDYMATTSAGQPGVTAEEQHVEQAMKTVTAMTLSGVEIVDHWQNPGTMEMFSLARLDLAAFKDSLDKAKELDAKTKEYIRQNAEKLHQQLEKEELKMNK